MRCSAPHLMVRDHPPWTGWRGIGVRIVLGSAEGDICCSGLARAGRRRLGSSLGSVRLGWTASVTCDTDPHVLFIATTHARAAADGRPARSEMRNPPPHQQTRNVLGSLRKSAPLILEHESMTTCSSNRNKTHLAYSTSHYSHVSGSALTIICMRLIII